MDQSTILVKNISYSYGDNLAVLALIVAVLLFAVTRIVERQHQQLALAS
ncbi:MAG: hypothetical protein AAF633_25685 [Chloroflexota bacterium]